MSWLDEMKKEVVFRARFSPAGRRLVGTAAVVAQPVEWYVRRRAAVRYNRQFPSTRMTTADGYALLPSGSIPGTTEIIDTCRRLFTIKQEQLAAAAPTKRKKGGKGSFLTNLLGDADLRANPLLIDFALSDALLSIVTNYLGSVPILNRVDLVYSIARPNHDEHISSQLFHQDHEGLKQAKVFLNIFDVDEEHGPFTFIPAGATDGILSAIRQQRQRAGAPHEGHYRDDEVSANGGPAAALQLRGPAGTAVVIDTSRCLHAGSRVHHGYFRLVLYIQYCTTQEKKANTFDAARFKNDPVRWLAVKCHAAAHHTA